MTSDTLNGLGGPGQFRNEGDTDLPDDATTPAVIELDTLFTGEFGAPDDVDWIALDVVAGESYRIDLFSRSFTREDGTVVEGAPDTLLGLYDADGNLLFENDDNGDDEGDSLDSRIAFTAEVTGRVYIAAQDLGGELGGYGVTVSTVAPDTIPDDASTEAVVVPGTDFASEVNTQGDRDWIALEVEAGTNYTISLSGADFTRDDGTLASALEDTFLSVYRADGTLLFSNDDGGPGLFSELSFLAEESETVFIEAASYEDEGIGGYIVSVAAEGPIRGDEEANVLEGTEGDDAIFGLGGDDTLRGLGGDDVLDGGAGADILDGGEGRDTASFATAEAGVTVFLSRGTSSEGDTLVSVEDVTGSAFDDVLVAGRSGSVVLGGAGDDRLIGFTGADILDGGEGNDLIIGRAGFNLIFGGSGDDRILGGNGDDEVDGGDGNDTISGNGGFDSLFGGAGNDRILGGADTDSVVGGDGDDTLLGYGGGDNMVGGFGHDRMFGGDGADLMYGDELVFLDGPGEVFAGMDVFAGMEGMVFDGNDTLFGDAGNDTMFGGGGNDRLFGGEDDDILYGDSDVLGGIVIPVGSEGMDGIAVDGNDTLFGDAGNDTLYGGGGNDRLFGGTGDDELYGDDLFIGGPTDPERSGQSEESQGAGSQDVPGMEEGETYDDVLFGGDGNDLLAGGFGDDVMFGGAGDDVIVSAFGNDVVSGGSGTDIFAVGPELNRVIIRDFEDGVDVIDISPLGLEGGTLAELGVTVDASSSRSVVLTFESGLVIALLGVDEADISIADFFNEAPPDVMV